MIYKRFKDKDLSLLGFGMMRLPVKEDKEIDQEQVNLMVDEAIKNGVNYFDTAYFYLNGKSEISVGIALNRYSRDSYYLADKFPGNILKGDIHPEEIFEEQLKKCNTTYFDFYLLHNLCERTVETYTNPKWGIIDYLVKQKELGRIKHLGFSCHAGYECLKDFLTKYKDVFEFVQLQVNYLDWTKQKAKENCELVNSFGLPVWVMEPVRGGKLANFNEEITSKFKKYRKDESVASWGFRFLQSKDYIGMILSGMSNIDQVKDNLKTFEEYKPLNEEEYKLLDEIVDYLKDDVPCTECKYCVNECPMKLEIPKFMEIYNNFRSYISKNDIDYINALDDNHKPTACLACSKCTKVCPQGIKIPTILASVSETYKNNK